MSIETMGLTVSHGRQSFERAYGSKRAEIEIAVGDLLGASAYFRLIKGRFSKILESDISAYSGPISISSKHIEKATCSKGFQNLSRLAEEFGFRASLEADKREFHPSPYLSLHLELIDPPHPPLALLAANRPALPFSPS